MSICERIRRLSLMCSSGLMRKRMLAPAWVLSSQGASCGCRHKKTLWSCATEVGVLVVARAAARGDAGRIDSSQREAVKQLGANAQVAVQLEDGARVHPPVFGVDVFGVEPRRAVGVAIVAVFWLGRNYGSRRSRRGVRRAGWRSEPRVMGGVGAAGGEAGGAAEGAAEGAAPAGGAVGLAASARHPAGRPPGAR